MKKLLFIIASLYIFSGYCYADNGIQQYNMLTPMTNPQKADIVKEYSKSLQYTYDDVNDRYIYFTSYFDGGLVSLYPSIVVDAKNNTVALYANAHYAEVKKMTFFDKIIIQTSSGPFTIDCDFKDKWFDVIGGLNCYEGWRKVMDQNIFDAFNAMANSTTPPTYRLVGKFRKERVFSQKQWDRTKDMLKLFEELKK